MVTWQDRPGAGRGRGLQAPAGTLWSLGPHPTCLGSPRESQGHSPRQSGPARTGVGGSRLPARGRGGGGELSQQACGAGGRRPRGQTAGLQRTRIVSHLRLQIPRLLRRRPGRAAHIWRSARCVGSRLPGQAWPPASASGAAAGTPAAGSRGLWGLGLRSLSGAPRLRARWTELRGAGRRVPPARGGGCQTRSRRPAAERLWPVSLPVRWAGGAGRAGFLG